METIRIVRGIRVLLENHVAIPDDYHRIDGVCGVPTRVLRTYVVHHRVQHAGVQSLGDSSVDVRIFFKTLPDEKWKVARELRRRIKNRFDEEGIEIPFPHRTLYLGTGESGALRVEQGSTE